MFVICDPNLEKGFKILHNLMHRIPVFNPRIRVISKPGDAARFAKEGIDQGHDTISVIGGDDIISEILPIVVLAEIKMAIIPIGIKNSFARHFNIPLKPQRAIEALFTQQTRMFDVMKVGENYFASNFDLGINAINTNGCGISEIINKARKTFIFDPFSLSLYEGKKEIHREKILHFRITVLSNKIKEKSFEITFVENSSFGKRTIDLLFKSSENHQKGFGKIIFSSNRDLPAATDGRFFILSKGKYEVETIEKSLHLIQAS